MARLVFLDGQNPNWFFVKRSCPTTGPLHVLCWLVQAEMFSENRKCNQFAGAQ